MRSDRLLLQDILESANEVIDATPATADEFKSDKFVQSHVLRHVQIIGEASWRLSQTLKDQHPAIPWKRIASMRHVLVHDYFQINWNRLFDAAKNDVPILKPQIDAILRSLDTHP